MLSREDASLPRLTFSDSEFNVLRVNQCQAWCHGAEDSKVGEQTADQRDEESRADIVVEIRVKQEDAVSNLLSGSRDSIQIPCNSCRNFGAHSTVIESIPTSESIVATEALACRTDKAL
eukprot:3379054-Rhodomonas_salina.1